MRSFSLLIQPRTKLAVGVVSVLITCGAQAMNVNVNAGGEDEFSQRMPTKSMSVFHGWQAPLPTYGGFFWDDRQLPRSELKHTQYHESSRHSMTQSGRFEDKLGDIRSGIKFANFDNFRPHVSVNEFDRKWDRYFDNERWRDVSVKHSNSMFRFFYPAVIVIVGNHGNNHGGNHGGHGGHKPDRPDIQLPEHGSGGDYCEPPKPVPLPAAAWLFGSGMVALGAGLRRKRKDTAEA